MKIGLVGGSYNLRSLPFNAQRSINLFPVMDESGGGKEVSALYGTPGLSAFVTLPDSPIRAVFYSSGKMRAFAVAGEGLYEIFSGGTYSLLGTLESNESVCSIAENATQMAICDGADLYILTYATDALAKVTDGDFPGAVSVAFQDQYFIVNKPGSAEAYVSNLADGSAWEALDFATAESSPDDLVRVFSAFGQVWMFGDVSTEVWYNSGNTDYPFARVEGAKMQIGCAAKDSVVDLDNTVFWLGKDKDGQGIVYKAAGYNAQRVSTHAIEYAIRQAIDISAIRGYSYQEDGHLFYVLTGGGMETTLVYDVSTGLWHERAYLESDGSYSQHRAIAHMFAFGRHLVGDYATGKVYDMSLSYYDDDGDEIRRERIFTHISDEASRFIVRELQVDFEYGVGLSSGQGSSPVAWLQTSNDGAQTWSAELQASIGAIGKRKSRAVWRRLGQFELFTCRVIISDPVKVAICGAYLK